MNLERSYITAARNGWDYSCCVKLNQAAAAATLQYVNVDIANPCHEEGLPSSMYYHPCTPSTPLPIAFSPPLSLTKPLSALIPPHGEARPNGGRCTTLRHVELEGNRATVTRNYFRRRIGGYTPFLGVEFSLLAKQVKVGGMKVWCVRWKISDLVYGFPWNYAETEREACVWVIPVNKIRR